MKKISKKDTTLLGMEININRRDFLNGTLLGVGAVDGARAAARQDRSSKFSSLQPARTNKKPTGIVST